ncbi:MAG TPA: tetratricopeptide repeat protein [Pseudacidobacterium sp.]|nr:tetratricopeptide repeat protein [Pseudacidobacterium sp.]
MIRSLRYGVFLIGSSALAYSQADPLVSAHSLLEQKQYTQAENLLRGHLATHPTSAAAHFLLGYALFREDRAKESLAEFTEGAKYGSPKPEDLKIVAADYVLLGDFTDADKWLTYVTKEAPEDADAWYLLGRTKYNENRFQEAIDSFQKTLALRPHDIKAENNLGLCYQGLNRPDEAKKAYENALAWQRDSPVKDAQPFLNAGILLLEQDQSSQALPYLEKAAALAPHNPKVLEQLGRAYDLLGMQEKAERALETAVALAPNASGLHYKLGQVYRREGKDQLAQQQFDICARLNSTHSSIETPNPAQQE